MRDIGDRFDISKSTVHNYIVKVCRVLVNNSSQFISWPTEENIARISKEFENISGFPGKPTII